MPQVAATAHLRLTRILSDIRASGKAHGSVGRGSKLPLAPMTGLNEIASVRALSCSPLKEEQRVDEERTLAQAVEQKTTQDQLARVDEEILVHEWRAEQL